MLTRQIFRSSFFLAASLLLVGSKEILAFSSGSSIILSKGETINICLRASSQEDEDSVLTQETVIEDDNGDEADELVDSITQKVEDMEGLWYSDDFYGPHGREWVTIAARLVGETASNALVAVKVTGDPNVPAGCETFKTASWPGMGETVPAEIQVRADPTDPDGFTWLPGELTTVEKNQIRLMCQYNVLMRSQGTFYKQKDDEGSDES